MTTTFSASTSGKTTTGSTPFDEIKAMEEQEGQRAQKEIAALDAEESEQKALLEKREKESEMDIKEKAKQELMNYRESDLSQLLVQGKEAAQNDAKQTKQVAEKNMDTVVSMLTKKAMEPDLYSTAA